MRRALLLLCLLGMLPAAAAAQPAAGFATSVPLYDAADPEALPVTPENLLASERFWPYQVELARAWTPPGAAAALPAGLGGVLIRVEPSGEARVDFGRDGLFELPVAATDVVERANRIRRGQLDKIAPNWLHAIGPRLLDSASGAPRPFRFEDASRARFFLSVFADPSADGFAALSSRLAPLAQRPEVLTVLFPQGSHPDPAVREQLRDLDWKVPYVLDHLSEPYTRSQLGEAPRPAVLLQTAEGRVLFQGDVTPDAVTELVAVLDRASAAGPSVASGGKRAPGS